MHVTDRIKRAKRARHVSRGGTCSPRKIFDFRPSEIAFGAVLGETARVQARRWSGIPVLVPECVC